MSEAEILTKAATQLAVEVAKATILAMTEATEGGRASIHSTRHAVTAETMRSRGGGPYLKIPLFNWTATASQLSSSK